MLKSHLEKKINKHKLKKSRGLSPDLETPNFYKSYYIAKDVSS